jgi:hypothetical protein
MSMFKTRNKKIYAGDSRVTLDAKHQDILSQYATDEDKLKAKKKEIHDIQKKINKLKTKIQENKGIPLIQEHHTLYQYEGELEQKQKEYERLQHNKGAQEYFLKTGDLLCQYYQHLEEVADHSGTSPPDGEKKGKKRGRPALSQRRGVKAKGKRNFSWMENTSTRGTNILSFFQQQDVAEDTTEDAEQSMEQTRDDETEETPSPSIADEPSVDEDGEDEEAYPMPSIAPDAEFDRSTALQHYLQEIDPNYKPPKSHTWMVDFCPVCLDKENQRRELLLQPSDGVLTCQVCGHMEQVVIDSEKPSYKDPPPEATYFAYKRINHYNELKNQVIIIMIQPLITVSCPLRLSTGKTVYLANPIPKIG